MTREVGTLIKNHPLVVVVVVVRRVAVLSSQSTEGEYFHSRADAILKTYLFHKGLFVRNREEIAVHIAEDIDFVDLQDDWVDIVAAVVEAAGAVVENRLEGMEAGSCHMEMMHKRGKLCS